MGSKRAGEALLRALPVALLIALVPSAALAGDPKEQWAAGLNGRIVDVDITSSGRTIIASSDGLITFTDDKGNKLKQPGFLSPAVRITSDGLKVAAGRASSMALIDNAGTTLWEKSLGGKVTGVGMDRAATLIAAGADDNYVYLFDGSGNELGKVPVGETPRGVAATGDRAVVGLPSSKVLLLDRQGKTVVEMNAGAPVNAVDISSTTLVAATETDVVAFSHGGQVQWRAALGSPARAVATTADGSLTLAAAQAGDANLYNAKGEFLWKVKNPSEVYTAVGLSDGGYFAAIGSRETTLHFYATNVSEAKAEGAAAATPPPLVTPKPTPTPRTESELQAQTVPTPSRAVIQAPGRLDPAWTKLQQTITGSPAEVTSAALSPDGAVIAMVSPKGLYFLDRSGGTITSGTPFSAVVSLKILQSEFSRDNQRFLISGCESTGGAKTDAIYGSRGSEVWRYDVGSGTCTVGGVRVSSDGSLTVNMSGDGTFLSWLDTNRQPRATNNRTPLSAGPKAFDLSPDGKYAAVIYGNTTLELYNNSAQGLAKDEQFLFNVDNLRFTPDGKLAVRAGPNITLFDPGSISPGQNMAPFWSKRVESVLAWAVMEDGFAAGTKNKEVVWVKGGKDIVNAKVDGEVNSVTLSANGKFLAASSTQAFKVWLYADDGRLLWEVEVSQPTGVSVANDGSVLVYANPAGTTTKAGTLHFFDLPTLDLDSSPSSAKVTVDGSDYGTTPVRIQGLKLGNHSITVSLAGYKDCTGTAGVSGVTQRLCLLVAIPGTSPPPATSTPSPTSVATTAAPATPIAEPSPAATAAPAPSPSPTPKKSPGFEALAAVAALGAAFAFRRKAKGGSGS